MNLSNQVKNIVLQSFRQAFPEFSAKLEQDDPDYFDKLIEITQATQEKFGHYQCNSAMKLTKLLEIPPRNIAEKWVQALLDVNNKQAMNGATNSEKQGLFSKIEIAGPGFINLTIQNSYLSNFINAQLHDSRLGIPIASHPLKVIIDYSSPNVAKEMHVGHLRTTIIGDCLARLFRFLGHQVLPLNHLGDWGTQFGMLIAFLKELIPSITEENKTPSNIDLRDLVQWYRAAKVRFDEDADFKKRSQLEVVKLQSGDPVSLRVWEHIREISRHAYQAIYDLLDIHLIERGESFYNPLLPGLIKDLEKKGLITISDGAKCVFLDGFVNRNNEPLPLILQKADGAYNYATTDLAGLRHRIEDENGDWIIYVVDAGQKLHLQMVFETAKKAGFLDPKHVRVDHVDFGLVLRPDGKKFKTREGETERLIDLLQLAIDKARISLYERNPEMPKEELEHSAKILGIDAVKYADLSCHRTSDYMFSYEKMLSFEGNTAAFLLYAYVRIQGIKRKMNVDVTDLIHSNAAIRIEEPSEINLGLAVAQFQEILEHTRDELLPNRLTDYLYRLAEKFHVFFHQCRVEGSEQQNSRLLLCEIVGRILKQGLEILGLNTLSRM